MVFLKIKNRIDKLEQMISADSQISLERIKRMTFAEFILFKINGDPGGYSPEEWEEWFCMYFGHIYRRAN